MHFTASQKKALIFIAAIFQLAVIYNWLDRTLHRAEAYNFTPFEEKFSARLDSIERVQAGDDALPGNQNPVNRPSAGINNFSSGTGIAKNAALQSVNHAGKFSPVNINTATQQELETLPRIGPAIAERILQHRREKGRFTAKKDIMQVKGIGPKTYAKLEALITVK